MNYAMTVGTKNSKISESGKSGSLRIRQRFNMMDFAKAFADITKSERKVETAHLTS